MAAEGAIEDAAAPLGLELKGGDCQVVGIVDLGPALPGNQLGADLVRRDVGQHSKDELVVAGRVDDVRIRMEQRPQDLCAELSIKAINVQRLELLVVREVRPLRVGGIHVGHEAIGNLDNRAVHSGPEAIDERDVLAREADKPGQQGPVEQKVTLDEEDVAVKGHAVERERERHDVVRLSELGIVNNLQVGIGVSSPQELLDVIGAIPGDDGHLPDANVREAVHDPAEDRGATHGKQGLVAPIGQGTHPPSIPGGQDDSLQLVSRVVRCRCF